MTEPVPQQPPPAEYPQQQSPQGYPPPGYPQQGPPPGYYQQGPPPPGYYYQPVYYGPPKEPMSAGIVFVVTLLFGLFGIIPAAIGSNQAMRAGKDTRPYWGVFVLTLMFWIGIGALIVTQT